MTPQVLTLLGLLGLAVVLFATEWVSVDLAGLILLVGLYATGLLPAEEAFRGFGHEVIVFLGSLFVVGRALVETGALDRLEMGLGRLARGRPRLLLPLLLVGTSAVSAFLSNTATVAAVLPVALALSRRMRLPASKLLLPLAFGSILGGTCTLIGTSTNIVVSGMLPEFGLAPLGLFELAPVGVPILIVGLAYLVTLGSRLLPVREAETLEAYGVRSYLAEIRLPAGSPWAGRTLGDLQAGRDLDVTVLGLVSEDDVIPIEANQPLVAGDHLLIEASPERLVELRQRRLLELVGERQHPRGWTAPALAIHELILARHSSLERLTLKEQQFRARYGASVLALYRRGEPLLTRLADVPLRQGDVLLVQGDLAKLDEVIRSGDLILLEQREDRRHPGRAWLTLGLFVGMIVVGGAGLMPFAMAALATAAVLVLTGCIAATRAYDAVDWRVLVMVACLLGLAHAMESTGTAAYLAASIVDWTRGMDPRALLAGFYLLTVLLTQPMSNQAAALVVLPLAMRTALELGLNPRTFAITVCLAASCSFITPLEPAALLVYGPGRYRFGDYFKVGLPLTLLVFAITMALVPWLWPLVTPLP